MNDLVESLMEELSCKVMFTIPLFGGIDVMESVTVTWITMAIMMVASLILVHGLRARSVSEKQATLESGVSFIYDFFGGLLGKEGEDYISYLIIVVTYTGIVSMIGLLSFKSPTKGLNVTISLAVMSIVLVGVAGIHKGDVKGWIESFIELIVIIVPINVLELSIRPLSLCMRLLDNMPGTITIMTPTKHLLPLIMSLLSSLYLDILSGVIQAYVLVFLTSLYMEEAIED